eukprot:282143-Chlamydomonas_euryale.AAC.1
MPSEPKRPVRPTLRPGEACQGVERQGLADPAAKRGMSRCEKAMCGPPCGQARHVKVLPKMACQGTARQGMSRYGKA